MNPDKVLKTAETVHNKAKESHRLFCGDCEVSLATAQESFHLLFYVPTPSWMSFTINERAQ